MSAPLNEAERLRRLRLSRNGALAGLLALLALCLLWETVLAPVRPGSLLWLKALPLLLPLPGVFQSRRYTYQWLSMYILLWFIEGIMRGWADHGAAQYLAWLEVLLSVWVFACVMVFTRFSRPSLQTT